MSQARASTLQTIKSLGYLYKVCSVTNDLRSYRPFSSVKLFSCIKSYSTLNSVAPDECIDSRNAYEFSTANGKNSSEFSSNWSFSESNNLINENPNSGYPETSMGIYGNHSPVYGQSYNYNTSYQNNILQHSSNRLYEDHRNLQTTGHHMNGVYNSNVSNNQQSSGLNHQIPNGDYSGRVNSQVLSYSQPDEKLDEVGQDSGLRGTLEEFDAFCKERKLKEAVEVLGLLDQNNVLVNVPRYLFLMKECGEAQALEEAKRVHEFLTKSVPHPDVSTSNKILEMYSKCGSMEDAYKVFDKMLQRNLTSWDTMITWLAKNGHGEDAIDMFSEFKKVGLKPDDQIFFGVFIACSVLGDMKEGLLHFESMSKDYDIIPSKRHYLSVVDMLGSAGYLNEAMEFIGKMPMDPDAEVWEVMMNQCRVHGDTELGDRCAELIELLDPFRLDEKSKAGLIPIKASDIAKEKENKRLSGLNPLQTKTKVYEYRAGDTSHPEHEKLYSQLRCLRQHMKEVGYVPETKFVLHDIDQESKEDALLSHSERLALSQALLTSPARAPVRIIKNLRVCGDCHNALKIISKLIGRLIVARDAKRFHHFENGVCSCGDYW